jgi:hypothetical protein
MFFVNGGLSAALDIQYREMHITTLELHITSVMSHVQ